MNRDEGFLLEQESDNRIDKYNSLVEKKIIFTRVELIKQFPYETSAIQKVVIPEKFNITDREFGGNAHKCAILKNYPYVLIINKLLKTIGIFVPKENLPKFTVTQLKQMAEWLRLPVDDTMKKDNLVNILTNY